jgi:hypothetical protein
MHTHTHVNTHTHTHTHTHARTHTHTHTRTHVNTHTRTHTTCLLAGTHRAYGLGAASIIGPAKLELFSHLNAQL